MIPSGPMSLFWRMRHDHYLPSFLAGDQGRPPQPGIGPKIPPSPVLRAMLGPFDGGAPMSILSYEIEQFNPYSPRAQLPNLTPYVPCQLGDQPQVVVKPTKGKSFHRNPPEPLDGEKAVNKVSTGAQMPFCPFLRRLSLRIHINHHGEEQVENSSARGEQTDA